MYDSTVQILIFHLQNPKRLDESRLMLVVDTNIFISQLSQLRQLSRAKAGSPQELVVIYIPWAVLGELDVLKSRHTPNNRDFREAEEEEEEEDKGGRSAELGRKARAAINFVNELLGQKSDRVRGQSGAEEREAEVYAAHSADDRILQTCLKLKSQGFVTVLYTNDKNLANMAMVSKVDAFRFDFFFSRWLSFPPSLPAVLPT